MHEQNKAGEAQDEGGEHGTMEVGPVGVLWLEGHAEHLRKEGRELEGLILALRGPDVGERDGEVHLCMVGEGETMKAQGDGEQNEAREAGPVGTLGLRGHAARRQKVGDKPESHIAGRVGLEELVLQGGMRYRRGPER